MTSWRSGEGASEQVRDPSSMTSGSGGFTENGAGALAPGVSASPLPFLRRGKSVQDTITPFPISALLHP